MEPEEVVRVSSRIAGLPLRLREIQRRREWTVQDMADRAGMPKRSLENYMRVSDPQLPGIEAASKMAVAFGVSLDWLLLSEGTFSDRTRMSVWAVTRAACLPVFQRIIEDGQSGAKVVTSETILGFTPVKLSEKIADTAADTAANIADMGGAYDTVKTAVNALRK